MHPRIALDASTVTANARAWQAYAKTPLYAVVKGNGYGWGTETLVKALDGNVDAFCVSDDQELAELRKYTATRAIVFGSVRFERLEAVLAANALPTISTEPELELALRLGARVRLGLRPATAWSGSSLEQLRGFAPRLAQADADVELWSHITDFDRRAEQVARFDEAVRVLRAAGVRVVGTDLASTMPLASDGASGAATRVGVGLFGATGGNDVPGVRCALRVGAPVVRIERLAEDSRVGYGNGVVPAGTEIATARCGYADGLSREIAGSDGVISIGMQYVSSYADRLNDTRTELVLLDESSRLDAFASRAGRLAHEIVTAFGNAAR